VGMDYSRMEFWSSAEWGRAHAGVGRAGAAPWEAQSLLSAAS
jgi:hypothetical protein